MKEKCLYCLDTGCSHCAPEDTTVSESPSVTGLSDELIGAIEHMAIAINLAPSDNPCVTMHPMIWLLWETILFKAGIVPDIE